MRTTATKARSAARKNARRRPASAQTIAKKSVASARPRPGEGNPSWCRSYVTKSQFINWQPRDSKKPGPGPITFAGGPGEPGKRVTVSISELAYERSEGVDLNLRISMPTGMRGMQIADGPISIEQALSFEEAVRAVFQAAREHGLIPRRTTSK